MTETTNTPNGSLIGYGRVSTRDQDTRLQRDALNEAGAIRIFEEKVSGKTTEGRPKLAALLDFARPGDTVCVWRLDRLGRNTLDLLKIATDLHERGIGLRVLTGSLTGTYTPNGEGKFFFTMMAAFAELERDILIQRTRAGIAAAKASGKKLGRPVAIDDTKLGSILYLRSKGKSPTDIAKEVGVGRSTVYRALAAAEAEQDAAVA
jgi:DNA invertase Pin-like site-specific DNA recombinase